VISCGRWVIFRERVDNIHRICSQIKMISRNQMIFLLLLTSLLLLLYMLPHIPFSLSSRSDFCSPCPPFQPLTSLSQLEELTKRSQCCGHVKTLNTLYRIEIEGGPLVFPDPLQEKLSRWLNGDPQLVQAAELQKVVQISGILSGESTYYNPLRARRPSPTEDGGKSREWAEAEIERTRESCDFCKPYKFTAKEPWGRIKAPGCVSAANVFKVAGPSNGLIISSTHNLFDIGQSQMDQLLHCAELWFKEMHSQDPSLVYPMLVWDTFPKSGASQAHPHLQTWLSRSGYSGQFETLLREAIAFERIDGNANYWRDMTELHIALGLGVRHGEATAIVPLTSHRDHEWMVVSEKMNIDFVSLLSAVLESHVEGLGVICRSLGMAFPPISHQTRVPSLPVIARVGSRGDCTNLDLYAFYSVNADPYITVAALKQTLANGDYEIRRH